MRRLIIRFIILGFSLMLLSGGNVIFADQLVWKPINPSFGGSEFNASWLLQHAELQKSFEEERADYRLERDQLQDFKESLNRQILSRLSSRLIQKVFGEAELEAGHYEIGDYIIDITTTDTGIEIMITDPTTGTETKMEIPYY